LANVGESRPDKISTDVHALAKSGVSTTTLGVGADYNEDLLEAMARSGDGNYYYVESPAQLPNIFKTELNGLSATRGVDVTLSNTPVAGVSLAEVLTECDKTAAGELRLPNLVSGVPVRVVVRLAVDAFSGEKELLRFKLAWHAPKDDTRHTAEVRLAVPAVPSRVFDGLADNAEVREQITLLELAKQKKAAAEAAAKGDMLSARKFRKMSASLVADSPETELMRAEALDQEQIDAALMDEDLETLSKRAKHQAYRRHTSKE
jgi:Ca-activated chloride channel homolog